MANQKALTIRQVELNKAQQALIKQQTPDVFIKERPIRGGQKARYVEGGYVVAQLNAIFGAVNWEFKVLERGESQRKTGNAEGEVWVYGELSIIDHAKGYRATRGQYGQHPIYASVPLGDAFKAATTDSLKKCASLFGIALDVYWQQLDSETNGKPKPKNTEKPDVAKMFEQAKKMLMAIKDTGTLIEMDKRIQGSKLYNAQQKKELNGLISNRVDILDNA